MGPVELRLLGPISLGPDDAPVPLGGPKQRAVLAKLALGLGQAVTAEELIELVWRDSVRPAQPRRTLQVYVANLRKLLRLRSLDIAGTGSAYRLVADRASVDVTAFEDLVAEATTSRGDDPVAALAAYEAAEALWRGRALADVVAEIGGLEAAALRLDEQRVQASEERLGLAVCHGDVAAAVVELEVLVDAEPWRELAAVHLMVGLYRQGRQADALAVAAATRCRLVEELGLEPSQALREAEQEILEHRVPMTVGSPPQGARPTRRLRSRLPAVITTFVGRVDDRRRLEAAMRRSRLVTLVGTGGVGKTRLAIEVVRRMDVRAMFVPLASTDAAGVTRTAIAATSVPIAPGAPAADFADAFAAEIGDGAVCLVLDNAEHVLEATAALAAELLWAVPDLTVVVTSREPLARPGEAVVLLDPLIAPDASALFADRAGLSGRTLDLDGDEVPAQVARLCAAVDNLPQGIEVAANLLRALQLSEVVERIGDRLSLLGAPVRSELSAHGTMLATIDWSYRRLDPAEQAVFQRLAMFPSGCTATAAEAVCHVEGDPFDVEDVIDLIVRLVDRSLVAADHRVSPTRFRMLETIRQFALDRCAESPTVDDADQAYVRWAVHVTGEIERGLRGPSQRTWRTAIDAELDNLRVGFDRAIARGAGEALQMAIDLADVRLTRGEIEISSQWLQRALASVDGDRHRVPRALATVSWVLADSLLHGLGGRDAVVDDSLEQLRGAGADAELLTALNVAAVIATSVADDVERCMRLTDEAERVALRLGDDVRLALTRGYAAVGHVRRGHLDAAAALAQWAVDTLLAHGDEVDALLSMRVLWVVAWRRGDVEGLRAQAHVGASIEERHDLDAFATLGRYWLAVLAVTEADHETAWTLVDGMLARRNVPPVQQAYQILRSMLLRRCGEVEQAWDELTRAQPVGSTLLGIVSMFGPIERGWCELELGRYDDARRSFDAARPTVAGSDDRQFLVATMEGHAAIALAREAFDEAAALLARADAIRREAPVLLNLHGVEVDGVRGALDARARVRSTTGR